MPPSNSFSRHSRKSRTGNVRMRIKALLHTTQSKEKLFPRIKGPKTKRKKNDKLLHKNTNIFDIRLTFIKHQAVTENKVFLRHDPW